MVPAVINQLETLDPENISNFRDIHLDAIIEHAIIPRVRSREEGSFIKRVRAFHPNK